MLVLFLLLLLVATPAWATNVPTCAQTPNCICGTPAPSVDNTIKLYDTDAPAGWEERALNTGDLPVSSSEVYIANTFSEFGTYIDPTEVNALTFSGDMTIPANQCWFSTTGIACEGATDAVEGLLSWSPTGQDQTIAIPNLGDSADTMCVLDEAQTLTNKTLAATCSAATAAANDDDTSIATTAFVQQELTGSGAPTITVCRDFHAKEIHCNSGGTGCSVGIAGSNFEFYYASFAADADDTGSIQFVTPSNLTGTTATVTLFWYGGNAACDNGADDDVCWTIDGDSFTEDDSFAAGTLAGTEVGVSDRCELANYLSKVTFPAFTHSWEPGELAILQIRRDTDETIGSCSDDWGYLALLLDVKVCFSVANPLAGES